MSTDAARELRELRRKDRELEQTIDTTITEILAGIYVRVADGKRPPESMYGSLKMWAHLQRQGIPVARCTIERIMRWANGWRGVTRTRRTPRTTETDPAAARAPDLVNRGFRVSAPNRLVVAASPTCR